LPVQSGPLIAGLAVGQFFVFPGLQAEDRPVERAVVQASRPASNPAESRFRIAGQKWQKFRSAAGVKAVFAIPTTLFQPSGESRRPLDPGRGHPRLPLTG